MEEEKTDFIITDEKTDIKTDSLEELVERIKYIPVRLTPQERRELKICESALKISDYTSKIDILAYNKKGRIVEQLTEICVYLSGLLLASNYNKGQKLLKDKKLDENEEFFQSMFEIARRHKINNPEKMRGEYGKLVYLLQDSQIQEIKDEMEMTLFRKVKTVYDTFEKANILKILKDPLMMTATVEIIDDKKKSRSTIKAEIKKKEAAIEKLALGYETTDFSAEKIRQCLYSIGDSNSFLNSNMNPLLKIINLLKHYFSPTMEEEEWSLTIQSGSSGARLSHNHARQYHYVYQSLTLWADITYNMFKLWHLAEEDLFDVESPYKLRDTGQGLNRVQYAPRVMKEMSSLLANAQQKLGGWVGSSVIHLGDHNVPNALMFIDKYTQVPRIINPIILTIEQIGEICANDKAINEYVEKTFGSVDDAIKTILRDFFTQGFDGSGADNFYDAGSCLDGRLTSAWNWTQKIASKNYYPLFRLCGFVGFDGDFQQ